MPLTSGKSIFCAQSQLSKINIIKSSIDFEDQPFASNIVEIIINISSGVLRIFLCIIYIQT